MSNLKGRAKAAAEMRQKAADLAAMDFAGSGWFERRWRGIRQRFDQARAEEDRRVERMVSCLNWAIVSSPAGHKLSDELHETLLDCLLRAHLAVAKDDQTFWAFWRDRTVVEMRAEADKIERKPRLSKEDFEHMGSPQYGWGPSS